MKTKTQIIAIMVLTVIAGAAVANLGNQQRRGSRPLPPAVQLTEAEENHILYMREEEKLARDVYLTLYELWGVEIFANISDSEQRHMDALENLVTRYELTDPVVDGIGEFTNPDFADLYDELVKAGEVSLEEALKVGVSIEELDIVDLEIAMEDTSARSVSRVFENLLAGSQNHLSAFQNAIETGTTDGWQQVGSANGSCCVCPQCGNMCQVNNQTGNGGNQTDDGTGQGSGDGNQNSNGTDQGGNGPSQGTNDGQGS